MATDFGVDMDKVRAFLREKSERRRKALDERYSRARGEFDSIVSRIAAEVKPERVWQ